MNFGSVICPGPEAMAPAWNSAEGAPFFGSGASSCMKQMPLMKIIYNNNKSYTSPECGARTTWGEN